MKCSVYGKADWGGGCEVTESVVKKDNHYLGEKKERKGRF